MPIAIALRNAVLSRRRVSTHAEPPAGRQAPAWLAMLLALALATPFVSAARADAADRAWVGTWATSPHVGSASPAARFPAGTTLRQIVRTSIGGATVRVRLSNEMGTDALTIGAAHVALRATGAQIVAGSDRALTFGGRTSVTIPPGAPVLSDPVALDVRGLSDLAVSLYLPNETAPLSFHSVGLQTNYIAPAGGDYTGSVVPPAGRTTQSYYFLGAVEVVARGAASAVVAFGDSITDGVNSTPDTNNRWPNLLAQRLQGRSNLDAIAVLNEGISANRIYSEAGTQHNALKRFDRDVLAQSGVDYLITLLGINDIGHTALADGPILSAQDIIVGLRQMIERAHAHGIAVYGATLTPIGGSKYDVANADALRQAVNQWIRDGGEFDAVIDFDRVTRDPAQPRQYLPAFDSGDHLHPSDAGYRAMADAIPLSLFKNKPAVGSAKN